jgi:hypothetical protein
MPIQVNPETGDIVSLGEDKTWKPAKIAVNPETLSLKALDASSNKWKEVTVHSQAIAQRIQDEIRAIQSGMYRKPETESKAYTGAILPISKDEEGGLSPAVPRVAHDIATLPQRTMEAAASAPPGSRELSQALVPTATETAALAVPTSAGSRLARVGGAAKIAEETAVPSAEKLIETSDYNTPAIMQSVIKAEPVTELGQSIAKDLKNNRFGEFRVPRVHDYLKQLDEATEAGAVSFNDFTAIRDTFRDFKQGPEKGAASLVADRMTKFLENIEKTPENIISGNPAEALKDLQRANSLWGAGTRSEQITAAQEEAVSRAGRTGSGANLANTLRQEIGRIERNKKLNKFFTEEERDQMKAIERGSTPGNITRLLGKFGLYHPITGWFPFIFSHMSGHKAIAAIGAGLGHVAQKASERITQKEIEALDELVRSRSPLGGTPALKVKVPLREELQRRLKQQLTSPTAQRALGYSALKEAQGE